MTAEISNHNTYDLFFMYHTAKLLGVDPRTIRRWIKRGKIDFKFDKIKRAYLFSLDEINRIRGERELPSLTKEEAIAYWENN